MPGLKARVAWPSNTTLQLRDFITEITIGSYSLTTREIAFCWVASSSRVRSWAFCCSAWARSVRARSRCCWTSLARVARWVP